MRHTPIVALDHITVNVRDLKAARAFYESALGALGMKVNLEFPTAFGFGSKTEKIFWLSQHKSAAGGGHYAFRVDNRAEVDAFHQAALEAGGTENGEPGPRPDYGPNYYAAFVKDREGNNIEVVCYARERARRTAPAQPAARAPRTARAPKQAAKRGAAGAKAAGPSASGGRGKTAGKRGGGAAAEKPASGGRTTKGRSR